MKEYFVFKKEYVNNPKAVFDLAFITDYEATNRFPIERDRDMVIIYCPSRPSLKWYVKNIDTHLYGRIEHEAMIDDGLFEI